jgi:hypothetical protein
VPFSRHVQILNVPHQLLPEDQEPWMVEENHAFPNNQALGCAAEFEPFFDLL